MLPRGSKNLAAAAAARPCSLSERLNRTLWADGPTENPASQFKRLTLLTEYRHAVARKSMPLSECWCCYCQLLPKRMRYMRNGMRNSVAFLLSELKSTLSARISPWFSPLRKLSCECTSYSCYGSLSIMNSLISALQHFWNLSKRVLHSRQNIRLNKLLQSEQQKKKQLSKHSKHPQTNSNLSDCGCRVNTRARRTEVVVYFFGFRRLF